MNTAKQHFGFSPKIVVLAVLAAFGPAHAEEGADVAQLIKPESAVSIGIGGSTGDDRNDRSIFGQYNGLRDHDYNLLLDIDYVTRNDETGQWTSLQARNLGLDNREVGVLLQKQGDWKFAAEYNEITKHDIRTVNTADTGVGSTHPVINVLGTNISAAGTGTDHDFELRRQGVTLSGEKWFTPNLQFEVSFKNEEKDGERRTGRGYDCATAYVCAGPASDATHVRWATLMIAEPIDTTTRQLDVKLNWSGDKFLLSAGYYGSFFNNSDGTVTATVPNTLLNATRSGLATLAPTSGGFSLQRVLQLPMALPPDNQAHQFYLDGFYAFTPTTRATAKISYAHATQDDSFAGNGLTGAPAGRSNLDGELNTTLVQLGLTAKPLPKLSLLGNVRYEDKEDETPLDLYNIENTTKWTNGHISNRKLGGKLEASYLLPQDIRATAGIDYEDVKRSIVDSSTIAGMSALRKDVDETGYRLELRRSLGETINAAIGYKYSRRRGDDWYNLNTAIAFANAGYPYGAGISASELLRLAALGGPLGNIPQTATSIFPVMLQDRDRQNWKLSADWTPTERLSMQFVFENNNDSYLNNGIKGVQDGRSRLYSVDATFNISEKWKLTGYASRATQEQKQAWSSGYNADLKNTATSAGLGVLGNPTARLQLGGDLSYSYDNNAYGLSLPSGRSVSATTGAITTYTTAANAAIFALNGGFPDVTFRQFTVKLFGQYAVQKNADIRVDLVHQRNELKEWSWNYNGTPYTYSDNTTVTLDPNQQVTFIGASYIYKF